MSPAPVVEAAQPETEQVPSTVLLRNPQKQPQSEEETVVEDKKEDDDDDKEDGAPDNRTVSPMDLHVHDG